MDSATLGYTAGLLDGEGYVSIYRLRNYSGKKNVNYQLKIAIAMCETTGIRFLQQRWGGAAHWLKNKHAPGGRRNKPIMRWYLCSNKAADLLAKVAPFLKCKRRQASLAIAFQRRVVSYKRPMGRNGITEIERAMRHELYLRMRELNRKGV